MGTFFGELWRRLLLHDRVITIACEFALHLFSVFEFGKRSYLHVIEAIVAGCGCNENRIVFLPQCCDEHLCVFLLCDRGNLHSDTASSGCEFRSRRIVVRRVRRARSHCRDRLRIRRRALINSSSRRYLFHLGVRCDVGIRSCITTDKRCWGCAHGYSGQWFRASGIWQSCRLPILKGNGARVPAKRVTKTKNVPQIATKEKKMPSSLPVPKTI